MTDVVDTATRSRMMAGIRGKNTKPELIVRSYLHKKGLRFRLHARDLPGAPDLVFPKHGAVIFVNGCFWHMHWCSFFRLPKTRATFWEDKLTKNFIRDEKSINELKERGWRIAIIWECAFRQSTSEKKAAHLNRLVTWVKSKSRYLEIPKKEQSDKPH